MKHLIWLIPNIAASLLLWWCWHVPLAGSGREFLAILLFALSILLRIFVHLDSKRGPIEGYNVVHHNDPL